MIVDNHNGALRLLPGPGAASPIITGRNRFRAFLHIEQPADCLINIVYAPALQDGQSPYWL